MNCRSLEERIARFEAAILYPVITPEFCGGRPVLEVTEAVLAGGAKLFQLRWKNPDSDAALFELAVRAGELAEKYDALLIIDDRIDIALASGADGVHVGQEDIPLKAARRIAPQLLTGISTHNAEEIRAAHRDGAGYLNVGPIFSTATKLVSYPEVGMENLRRYLPEIKIPFSVMGGIKEHHLPAFRELGVKRPAMVTGITAASDVEATVKKMLKLLQ